MKKEKKITYYTYKKHTRKGIEFYEIHSQFILSKHVSIQFDVGSIHDPLGKEGLVHLIEHLFSHASKDEYLENEYHDIQKYAYTYKERTVYSAKSNLASVETLCNVITSSLLKKQDSKVLQKEIETITSEILESTNNRSNIIYNTALKKCGLLHPESARYTHDIKGSQRSIKEITIGDVNTFIESNYFCPKIVIATPSRLNRKEIFSIFEIISKLNWNTRDIVNNNEASYKHNFSSEKHPSKEEYKCTLNQFNFIDKSTLVYGLCIQRPQTLKHDVYLGFLHEYLAGNWSSILTQKLRIEKQLTYFTNSRYYSYSNFCLLYVYFDITPKNIKEAKKISLTTIQKVLKGEIHHKICVATNNMRTKKLIDIYRYEHDLVYDFLDMLNLKDNKDTKKTSTLATYISETKKITDTSLKKYLKSFLIR